MNVTTTLKTGGRVFHCSFRCQPHQNIQLAPSRGVKSSVLMFYE